MGMNANCYSLQVFPLREDTVHSGAGERRGYFCWVYYEPSDEEKVIKAWKGLSITITDGEREVVDPDTSIEAEKLIMSCADQVCNFSMYEYEILKESEAQQEH